MNHLCVCRFGISFTYVIESIDFKLISVCLINDYSLIADLHIFVYERAEFSPISLEFTKVKLSILNNFDTTYKKISSYLLAFILPQVLAKSVVLLTLKHPVSSSTQATTLGLYARLCSMFLIHTKYINRLFQKTSFKDF